MKKIIKTITCHEVYNHGASLQEYALLKFIETIGHEATVIHYKPDYLSKHFQFKVVGNPKFDKPIVRELYLLAKLPGRLNDLKRKRSFDEFSAKYIKSDDVLYKTNDELKDNLPEADAYICGSDQIWNSFFQNGKDPAFYLDFVPDQMLKISYAASFATDELDNNIKDFVKEKVSRIDHISVRETSALKILEDLSIINAIQVLDPVFLLTQKYWHTTFVEPIKDKFVFVYDCDSNSIIKSLAQKIAKEKGLKIFTVDKNIKYADKNFFYQGPSTFLSLIYNAEVVIANSFHALAFSLIFNKKFIIVNRNEQINTRMRDLMALTKTQKMLGQDLDFDLNSLENLNYDEINELLEELIIKSKNFLTNAIDDNCTKN